MENNLPNPKKITSFLTFTSSFNIYFFSFNIYLWYVAFHLFISAMICHLSHTTMDYIFYLPFHTSIYVVCPCFSYSFFPRLAISPIYLYPITQCLIVYLNSNYIIFYHCKNLQVEIYIQVNIGFKLIFLWNYFTNHVNFHL